MKLYLVQIEMFDYASIGIEVETNCNIYSSFEKAKEEGLKELKARIKVIEKDFNMEFSQILKREKVNYEFIITELTDLEYAEKFEIKYEFGEEYDKLEPTHKVYELDYKGNINYIFHEYRNKNSLWKNERSICVYPENLEEIASENKEINNIISLEDIRKKRKKQTDTIN